MAKRTGGSRNVAMGDKIKCLCCGMGNQSNFYATKDPFRKYFAKIPYCKNCIKEIYNKYLKKYNGNINMAIYYLCRKIDLPYIHSAFVGAVENINNPNAKIQGEDSIVSAYIKNLSFSEANGWGCNFDDSQGENEIDGLSSFEETIKVKRSQKIPGKEPDKDKYDVIEYDTDELIRKWGLYDNSDLIYLESEYLDWSDKLNGIHEKSIDIMVKQVCLQCNEIRKDRENGANVDKKLATLQSLLKTSGLIEAQKDNTDDLSVGMLISEIEHKRPVKTVDPELEDVNNIQMFPVVFLLG